MRAEDSTRLGPDAVCAACGRGPGATRHENDVFGGGHAFVPASPAPTEADQDTWCETVADLGVTHVVHYRPEFQLKVKLPPWVDPDAWLAQASLGWNDWFGDVGEHWTEPGGIAWVEVDCTGSMQDIDEAGADD